MIKKMISIASAIVLLASLIVGFNSYDSTLAKTTDVSTEIEKVEGKIDVYLINQELADIRKQMYEIRSFWSNAYEEDHGEAYKTIEQLLDFIEENDPEDEKDYRELQERKDELEDDKKIATKKLKGEKTDESD